MAHALSVLLHTTYGITLKWEPHGDRCVWGEGSIGVRGADLSLVRKGTIMDDLRLEKREWEKWVDTSSPHAPMVWKSHFLSLLVKCVCKCVSVSASVSASDKECHCANLRSVMWVVGAKGYLATWWRGALWSFHVKARLKRVVAF